MELFTLNHLNFAYPEQEKQARLFSLMFHAPFLMKKSLGTIYKQYIMSEASFLAAGDTII